MPGWAKVTVIVLLLVVVAVVLIGIYGNPLPRASSSQSGSSKSSASSFSPITFTGSGDKNTAPFTIPTKEWIIDWECELDEADSNFLLSIMVLPRGEDLPVDIILGESETSGSSYIYSGSGDYYLRIIIINLKNWEIVVRPA